MVRRSEPPLRLSPVSASVAPPTSPEECLLLAVRARTPGERLALAEQGLAFEGPLDPDTLALLTRQLYVAHLDRDDLVGAEAIARELVSMRTLADVAHHDLARLLAARNDLGGAIASQRLAARNAPAERRSFQLWSLATLQHFAGDVEGALTTLERALRSSVRDRALIKAHTAFVRLSAGLPVARLDAVRRELARSPNREGYGQYLLGMIAHAIGDAPAAIVHLRAFLRRNEAIDPAKRITIAEELRRARAVLATLAHD